ncbi:MAG: zinc-binding alcohol dehydrogenase [Chloroflexota bacterium]
MLSGVSAGSELLIYRGQAPAGMAVDETIDSLAGQFNILKYGYASVGRVIDGGSAASREWLGRHVFAFNPHESHITAKPSDVLVLPDNMTPETAVFLPNMETAVSLIMDGRPVIGEQVAVLGQGIVGLLTVALLAEFPLSSLVTFDTYPLRREWSRTLGANTSLNPIDPDVVEQGLAALSGDRSYMGADLVYELSGNPAALDLAVSLTGYNGRIVVGSWYGNKTATLDLGGRFHRSHMQLISTQVSHMAPQWLGRWTKDRRMDVAMEMLRRIHPERLITHRLPIDQAVEGYRQLDQVPDDTLQMVFTYPAT